MPLVALPLAAQENRRTSGVETRAESAPTMLTPTPACFTQPRTRGLLLQARTVEFAGIAANAANGRIRQARNRIISREDRPTLNIITVPRRCRRLRLRRTLRSRSRAKLRIQLLRQVYARCNNLILLRELRNEIHRGCNNTCSDAITTRKPKAIKLPPAVSSNPLC